VKTLSLIGKNLLIAFSFNHKVYLGKYELYFFLMSRFCFQNNGSSMKIYAILLLIQAKINKKEQKKERSP
jgi:hypothetical protein